MNRLMQSASTGALIALIAAAPVAAFAQSETAEEPKVTTEQSADAEVTADTEENSDVAATDSAVEEDAEAGAETDMAADADADVDADAATDEQTDMAADAEADATADTEMSADADNTLAPMDNDGADMENTDMAAAEEPAKPVDGQITMQDADTVLAEDLLGATVYNSAEENVGDINDLIIGLDGSVKGVVIGVGGFLGLGEKQVAVQMAALDVVNRDDGTPRLVTSATKTDLEAAPEFVSASDQAAAQQMQDMQPAGDTMGGVQPTE